MKYLIMTLLFTMATATMAHDLDGKYKLDVRFGETKFIDYIDIKIKKGQLRTDDLCKKLYFNAHIIGEFNSPGAFKAPLLNQSCLGYQGYQQIIKFSININEGNGPVTYIFSAYVFQDKLKSHVFRKGTIEANGKKVGQFSGMQLGEENELP